MSPQPLHPTVQPATPMTEIAQWNYDEWLPSDTTVGSKVISCIVENMQRIGWPENEIYGIHVSLEEAIINAIKHGNQRDPEKRVHVIVNSTAEDFYLLVADEGPGFDPNAVPDCTAPENLELGSGRGLLMMRHYMDDVIYNETGNQLELRKNRSSQQS